MVDLHGGQLIGASTSAEGAQTFAAADPRTGEPLGGLFHDATDDEIDRALALASDAAARLRALPREAVAALLERIATEIEALGDRLLDRIERECALPRPRLTMECGRTTGQLRLFADVVRDGAYLDVRVDEARPDRQPLPRPQLQRMLRPIGPVAVFGAGNFPLAFSVAGGDTASALAAGCPVVVKAHPHHPGTSELVGRAIVTSVSALGLPDGTFSMVHGAGHEVGAALVRHPATRAVGFTGSFRGGKALFDLAMTRDEPIPVYAEMGSVNPVFLLPHALAERGAAIAEGLAASVQLGVGQFCTNPGLVLALDDDATRAFAADLGRRLADASPGVMLHRGLAEAYRTGLAHLRTLDGVTTHGGQEAEACRAAPALLITDARTFRARPELGEELFGPATVLVRCPDLDSLRTLAGGLQGQLTATIHATAADHPAAATLLPLLEDRAGRIVFNAFPTGVEVCSAMQHGGPFPATTDTRTTSVGTAAIHRFLRPVCYQDVPADLLPAELR